MRATRTGGVLARLLHPRLPPPPPALLFPGLTRDSLPFRPDAQLASFLMGALSDLLTLATEFMSPRRLITLVLNWRAEMGAGLRS